MILREVHDGELVGPSCPVCGSIMVPAGDDWKCVSCGTTAPQNRQKMREPSNAEEWQEAVDCAQFFLAFDSAKQYGLLTGGPEVDSERCCQMLKRGAALGYAPQSMNALIAKYLRRSA